MTIRLVSPPAWVVISSGPAFEIRAERYTFQNIETGRSYVADHDFQITPKEPPGPMIGEPYGIAVNLHPAGASCFAVAFGVPGVGAPRTHTSTQEAVDQNDNPIQIVTTSQVGMPPGALFLAPYPTVSAQSFDKLYSAMEQAIRAAAPRFILSTRLSTIVSLAWGTAEKRDPTGAATRWKGRGP